MTIQFQYQNHNRDEQGNKKNEPEINGKTKRKNEQRIVDTATNDQ